MLIYLLLAMAAFSVALLLMALARAVRVLSLRGAGLLAVNHLGEFLDRLMPVNRRRTSFRVERRVLRKPWGW